MEQTGPYLHPYATPLHGTMAPSGKLRTIVIEGAPHRVVDLRSRWDQGPEQHIVGEIYSYHEAYLDDGRDRQQPAAAWTGAAGCWRSRRSRWRSLRTSTSVVSDG